MPCGENGHPATMMEPSQLRSWLHHIFMLAAATDFRIRRSIQTCIA